MQKFVLICFFIKLIPVFSYLKTIVNQWNLIIRFKCKLNQLDNCQNYTVDFSNKKSQSSDKLVVIITSTVLPIIACVIIITGFVYLGNNKSMKKCDW